MDDVRCGVVVFSGRPTIGHQRRYGRRSIERRLDQRRTAERKSRSVDRLAHHLVNDVGVVVNAVRVQTFGRQQDRLLLDQTAVFRIESLQAGTRAASGAEFVNSGRVNLCNTSLD